MDFLFNPETRERKILALFGGFIAETVLGTIYITGNITIYMASYLQHLDQDVTTSDLSIIFPLQVLGISLTMIAGPYLVHILSARYTLLFGNCFQIATIFITSYLKNYFLICLIYGLMQGIAVGISYAVPLLVSWSHFPKYKGLVSGVILGGFGLGSSIFNLVSTHLINPENRSPNVNIDGFKYFNSEISNRYPGMLRVLCLIYFILTVLATICMAEQRSEESDMVRNEESISVSQGVKSKEFKLMAIMAFCSVIPGYFVANCYKVFGQTKINDDIFLAIVGSVSSIVNGSGRIIWGGVIDRYGFKKSYRILLGTQFVMMFSFYYIAANKLLYITWVCIILGCEGGHFVLFSTLVSQLFGKTNGAKIYSIFTYAFSIAAISTFVFQIYIVPMVGFEGLILFFGSIPLISVLVLSVFNESIASKQENKSIELA